MRTEPTTFKPVALSYAITLALLCLAFAYELAVEKSFGLISWVFIISVVTFYASKWWFSSA